MRFAGTAGVPPADDPPNDCLGAKVYSRYALVCGRDARGPSKSLERSNQQIPDWLGLLFAVLPTVYRVSSAPDSAVSAPVPNQGWLFVV
jgi:hypothetical protein